MNYTVIRFSGMKTSLPSGMSLKRVRDYGENNEEIYQIRMNNRDNTIVYEKEAVEE